MTPTTQQIAAELSKLQALLAANPSIPSPVESYCDGKPSPTTPYTSEAAPNPICTALIKGAIAGLSPSANLLGIYLEEMDGTDDAAPHIYGEMLSYCWARDIRGWISAGTPDRSPSLPPPPVPSDFITANLQAGASSGVSHP
jgi:hypothetical protein